MCSLLIIATCYLAVLFLSGYEPGTEAKLEHRDCSSRTTSMTELHSNHSNRVTTDLELHVPRKLPPDENGKSNITPFEEPHYEHSPS